MVFHFSQIVAYVCLTKIRVASKSIFLESDFPICDWVNRIVVSSVLTTMVPVCHCHSKQCTLRIVLGFLKKLPDPRDFVTDL